MPDSAAMASDPSSSSKTLASESRARKSTVSLRSTLSRTSTLLKTNVPDLDELKLSHILNGETCPPISFPDFASFITHKEFSTENLLFVIWFRSYRARYEALGKDKTHGVPVPSTRLGDRYSPFKYLDKAIAEGIVGAAGSVYGSGSLNPLPDLSAAAQLSDAQLGQHGFIGDWKPCQWATEDAKNRTSACDCTDSAAHQQRGPRRSFFSPARRASKQVEPTLSPAADHVGTATSVTEKKGILHGTMHPPLPPAGTILLEPKDQPMRDEALRAFATFLQKGGSRELGIADELREFARVTLRRSCAPECFLPIYDEVYSVIENQSLPHFLGYAKTNINRPKQLFWYWVGFADFMIGVLLFLLPTLLLRQTAYQYRLARIPSILFAVFGAMQFYSAWRGFCNQVWGRRSRQIRPWEMDEMSDEEAALRDETDAAFEAMTASGGGGTAGQQVDEPNAGVLGYFREPFGFGISTTGGEVESKDGGPDKSGPPEMKQRRNTFALPTLNSGVAGGGKLSLDLDPYTEAPLPEGVHPLTDLGGHSPSAGEIPWAISFPTPAETQAVGPTLEDEMSPIALRQLQIRRATVKQPAAELAFPIFDPEGPAPPAAATSTSPSSAAMSASRTLSRGSISPVSAITSVLGRQRSVITPCDMDDPLAPASGHDQPKTPSGQHAALPSVASPSPTSPESMNKAADEGPNATTSDLSSLLRVFKRKEPVDKEAYRQSEDAREAKLKVFGPEQLVVDPRVKKVMEGIVRDILIVGGITGVVFVVLVFAAPIAAVV